MKILANDGISPLGKELLEQAGFDVITDKVDQLDLAKAVNEQEIDMILVRSATTVRKEVIDACPRIKLIGRGGVGMDNKRNYCHKYSSFLLTVCCRISNWPSFFNE